MILTNCLEHFCFGNPFVALLSGPPTFYIKVFTSRWMKAWGVSERSMTILSDENLAEEMPLSPLR